MGAGKAAVRLWLLDGFELSVDDNPVEVSFGAQRLLAILALNDHPLQRSYLAGTLWSGTTDERAAACLRSTLWRLRRISGNIVITAGRRLRLAPDVKVDLHMVRLTLNGLLASGSLPPTGIVDFLPVGELLPDWYDDWVTVERERYRQYMLHSLDTLGSRLLSARRFAEAGEVALIAIRAEPLRDSGHRLLISVHLEENNPSEAIRAFATYRDLLRSELGIAPPEETQRLVAHLLPWREHRTARPAGGPGLAIAHSAAGS